MHSVVEQGGRAFWRLQEKREMFDSFSPVKLSTYVEYRNEHIYTKAPVQAVKYTNEIKEWEDSKWQYWLPNFPNFIQVREITVWFGFIAFSFVLIPYF